MNRIVLVAPDSRMEQHVRVLAPDDMLVVPSADPDTLAARLSHLATRPELVVFGAQLSRHRALALASSARQFTDAMAIVSDEPDILVDAMRSGISEVLPTTVRLDVMDAVLARAHEFSVDLAGGSLGHSGEGAHGRVITVTAPKGGVGKTTLACNIAVGLAIDRPGTVALVDLDLQFGDVAATLDLEPAYSLSDAVARSAARDSLVLRSHLTRHSSSLLVLTGPDSPASADNISPAQVAHLLRQLADEFPYVVVDTSPGLGEHKLTILEHSTDLVSITSMDVASVRGLRKELDVLGELGLLPQSRHTVVNLAERASGLSVGDIERAVGAHVDVVLPRTTAVLQATNRGIPVIIDRPRDRVARGLRLLVRRLESVQTRKGWRAAGRKERVS